MNTFLSNFDSKFESLFLVLPTRQSDNSIVLSIVTALCNAAELKCDLKSFGAISHLVRSAIQTAINVC